MGLAILSGQGSWAELGCLAGRATEVTKDKEGKKRERDVTDGPFGQDKEKLANLAADKR